MNLHDVLLALQIAQKSTGDIDLSDYYTKAQTDGLISAKVDKVTGKGLSTNDFTDEYKLKLAEQVGRKYYVNNVAKGEVFNTDTTASGDNSHAEGTHTTASGAYSHAEGAGTTAEGDCSHAEGAGTKAIGQSSHAEGQNTIASGDFQHVMGKYNIEDTESKYAFIIGNGTRNGISTFNRSNAFAIDWNGNIYVNNSETGVNVANLLERVVTLETELATLKAKVGA